MFFTYVSVYVPWINTWVVVQLLFPLSFSVWSLLNEQTISPWFLSKIVAAAAETVTDNEYNRVRVFVSVYRWATARDLTLAARWATTTRSLSCFSTLKPWRHQPSPLSLSSVSSLHTLTCVQLWENKHFDYDTKNLNIWIFFGNLAFWYPPSLSDNL